MVLYPKISGFLLAVAVWGILSAAWAADCGRCHAPGGFAPEVPGGLYASAHSGVSCLDCHAGAGELHTTGGVSTAGCGSCHGSIYELLEESAHAPDTSDTPSCYACHGSAHTVERTGTGRSAPAYAPAVCTRCHGEVVGIFLESAHGSASAEGRADAPGCLYCHGEPHELKPVEKNETLAPAGLPVLCGECHKGKPSTVDSPFTIPDPVSQLRAGVHGEIDEKTGKPNAGCTDCHGTHNELPSWVPDSSTNFMNVAAACGRCHEEERELYSISVHGLAVAAGLKDSPVCTDCHGDHNVTAIADPGFYGDKRTRTVAICSSCHYALALSTKFGIPNDRVPTFERSYHGVVSEGGKATAADCGSCHRVHDVLPPSDPRSSVHPSNLEKTCGSCHLGATERFVNTSVHDPGESGLTPSDIVAAAYIVLIVLVVGGMLGHNFLDYVVKAKKIREAQVNRSRTVTRLTPLERIQHAFLLLSFFLLAFTGFAIKYPSAWFFAWLVKLEGPYPVRVTVHKALGTFLIGISVFHVGYVLFTRQGRNRLKAIFPQLGDFKDAVVSVLHKLGLTRAGPQYGEFNYAEKAEYWSLVWGILIMASTGIYMWFDPYIQELFPFWFYSVVRTVHLFEAYLAVLAIIIWHLYHVMFDPDTFPMNFAWLDGKITEKRLLDDRVEYLKKLRTRESRLKTSASNREETTDGSGQGGAD
ncbi:MAG: cytochrome c3 family protein [Candidatus Coatesbacteria bacterium]|nr:MAG: cytochrome c3 family protein [Candidatus Coatesbacteria bacterium]